MRPYTVTTSAGVDLVLRPATRADVPALAALNAASYPSLAEEHVVWSEEQLLSHLDVFPEGQIVADADGVIVGAVSSLVVDLGRDPYRSHTFEGITDHSWFTNHDAEGDTLYGADACVHPDWRRNGIASALYEGRRRLCQTLGLRRIVLGGRLFDYHRHAAEMSAHEYVRKVEAGELSDPVLTFQMGEGFRPRRVMPHYLQDPNSLDHAAFLEWLNPEYVPRDDGRRKVRVTAVQYGMRRISTFEEFATQVEYFVDVAAGYGAEFVLLPELVTAQLMCLDDVRTPQEAIRRLTGYTARIEEMFAGLAERHGLHIIGGSHPTVVDDAIHNMATLYTPSGHRFRQPKIHITPDEARGWGITGGDRVRVFDTPKARIGICVCYDVEFPEMVRAMVDQGAELIFVPFSTDDRQAYLRVRYCAHARAIENVVYLVLAGNVGTLPQVENMDVHYAASAVITPSDYAFARDGVRVEATQNTEGVITCDLDLDALHGAVHTGSVRPRLDRRPDLFQFGVRTVETD